MAVHRLDNYLKAYRRQTGLTQRELAFLLGCRSKSQVSRYEKRCRLPSLRIALAFEVAFNVPVAKLFAGISHSMGKEIDCRCRMLTGQLEHRSEKDGKALGNSGKLEWLAARCQASQIATPCKLGNEC